MFTHTFVVVKTKVKNKAPNTHPLPVTVLNEQQMYTTRTCDLYIPQLPLKGRLWHALIGLRHYNIEFVPQFCDTGHVVTFDSANRHIFYKGKLIQTGPRHLKLSLWFISLSKTTIKYTTQPSLWTITKNRFFTSIPLGKPFQYTNQCCFSLRPSTWIKSIVNNELSAWPGVTTKNVHKYLHHQLQPSKGINTA